MAAFLEGYAAVWTAFGIAGFLGDVSLHRFVDAHPWLEARPWLIAGSVLTLAGAFQFSPLKEACLRKCRLPGLYLVRHYGRGTATAFALGRGHGLFCVGCCWALMLVTFAAGFANLWWMAALTAVMVYEKTGRRHEARTGRRNDASCPGAAADRTSRLGPAELLLSSAGVCGEIACSGGGSPMVPTRTWYYHSTTGTVGTFADDFR
jgi:predicted metal-binding membrane protein